MVPKRLSSKDIEYFHNEGYVSPIRVMSEAEAGDVRKHLEEFEARTGGPLRGDLRHKAHLLFPWLADLVRNEKILDAVEDLYGPDLLCWTSKFLHQGSAEPGVRVKASGFDILGTERAGRRDRLGRAYPEQ